MNKEKTGIRQRLSLVEEKVVERANRSLTAWRKKKVNEKEAKEFYQWLDTDLPKEMSKAAVR